jgi:hypothetical protein
MLVFGTFRIEPTHSLFEAVLLVSQNENLGECGHGLFLESPTGMVKTVLRKIAHARLAPHDDPPGIGRVQTGQDAKKSRLTGAVRAGESDPITIGNVPGHVLEDELPAKGFGEFVDLQHAVKKKAGSSSR